MAWQQVWRPQVCVVRRLEGRDRWQEPMTGVWPWQPGPEGLSPGQKARHTDVPGVL